MAAIAAISESTSAGQAMFGSFLLVFPIPVGAMVVRAGNGVGERQQASFEEGLRLYVKKRGGHLIEPPKEHG